MGQILSTDKEKTMDIRAIGNLDYQPRAGKSGSPKAGDSSSGTAHSKDLFEKQEAADISLKNAVQKMISDSPGILPGTQTRQFADSYGRVTHLALTLSGYVSGMARQQVLNAYKILFTQMEPDTRFSVVVDTARDRADVEKLIKDNNVPNPERIKFIDPPEHGLTVWARDMMVPMFIPGDAQRTALLEQTPLHNWHNNDSVIPSSIVAQNPSIILDKEPRIVTDGGDVMANARESFVGYYSIAATSQRLAFLAQGDEDLKDSIIQYYEKQTGRKVVDTEGGEIFPFKFVPVEIPDDAHRFPFRLVANPEYKTPELKNREVTAGQMYQDIAVMLFQQQFGKTVNVMGKDDPATPDKEEPATDHLDMGLTPVDDRTFFLGEPRLVRDIFASMTPAEKKQASARLSKMAGKPVSVDDYIKEDRNRDNPRDFDAYEKILKDKGYEVIRLPHAEPGSWGGPYISYNNCLMERFDKDGRGVKRVFLPIYGIAKLDEHAMKEWRKQGFDVIPMRMEALSARWGALRCITNWLERSPKG
jgi:hypothetical protein